MKSTYALDLEAVQKLERVAAELKVSKSEVLRRAIDLIAREHPHNASLRLQALDNLQSLELTRAKAEAWEREVRRERVRSSARHEWHKT